MINWLFNKLRDSIDAQITHRILLFHDALVRRGQIPEAPKETGTRIENESE